MRVVVPPTVVLRQLSKPTIRILQRTQNRRVRFGRSVPLPRMRWRAVSVACNASTNAPSLAPTCGTCVACGLV